MKFVWPYIGQWSLWCSFLFIVY